MPFVAFLTGTGASWRVPPLAVLASLQPAQRLSKLSSFQAAYLARSCRSSTDRRRQRRLVSDVGLIICSEGKVEAVLIFISRDEP